MKPSEDVRIATPAKIDGISFVPTLLGKGVQKQHPYLYFEFAGYGGQQGVRMGDWKAVRKSIHKGNLQIELYNLAADLSEANNVAADNPKVLRQMEQIMRQEHVPSDVFALKVLDAR